MKRQKYRIGDTVSVDNRINKIDGVIRSVYHYVGHYVCGVSASEDDYPLFIGEEEIKLVKEVEYD
jgi:hypothetical protein